MNAGDLNKEFVHVDDLNGRRWKLIWLCEQPMAALQDEEGLTVSFALGSRLHSSFRRVEEVPLNFEI